MDDKGTPIHSTSMSDILMNCEVLLPRGEDLRISKVIQQSVDSDGKVIGYHNDIPVLSTILCDVEFPYGAVKPYSENIIAGNILNQVNADGYHHQIIDSILEHSKDKRAVEKKDKWIVSKLGNRSMWKSNVG